MCNSQLHRLFECDAFKKTDVQARRHLVKTSKLCFNCLVPSHEAKQCPSKKTCKLCSKRHNTLLHIESSDMSKTEGANIQCAQANATNGQVLLATALMNIRTTRGEVVTLRALLDIGSQRSFIRESAVQFMGLRRRHSKISIGGIGSHEAVTTKGIVDVDAIIRENGMEVSLPFSALIIPNITSIMPAKIIHVTMPNDIGSMQLADPGFNKPSQIDQIDLLLGADIYGSILINGFKHGYPCAQNTKFGWVLFGSCKRPKTEVTTRSFVTSEDLDKSLRRFWDIEEPSTSSRMATSAELEAEKLYLDHTYRKADESYSVELPFTDNLNLRQDLKDSARIAYIRVRQLEKRLEKDGDRKQQYHQFMEEYLRLGHMEKVPESQRQTEDSFYLPHHKVIKVSSSTTKLRVVFNASQKSPGGKSLNIVLHVGPAIQNNLLHLLIRWRSHKFVIAADIEKMYRQIEVHENYRNYQRILWRFNSNNRIDHFRLKTVTYGTACAPFLAIRTLQQLAIDEQPNHPEATEIINQDFYVDDLLTGSSQLDHLKRIQTELIATLQQGGFHLRKWAANHPDLLEHITPEDREVHLPLDFEMAEEVKTLGLQWHPGQDVFSFKVQVPETTKATKRIILSEVAKLYDPLGWLQPCIVIGKITIQQLWLLKLDWDDEIPEKHIKLWLDTRNQLYRLQDLRIPRWIGYTNNTSVQLHGFCDASSVAFAAVIYLRVRDQNGSFSTKLLTAKTKVAPLKTLSIPRLELSSAVLLIETMMNLKEAYGWSNVETFYWTDSKIVLAWIQKPAITWKVFIANRIDLIHQDSTPDECKHVPTTDNPADIASRGIMPERLIDSSLWWEGPHWLLEPTLAHARSLALAEDHDLTTSDEEIIADEMRSISMVATESGSEPEILTRYSSIPKLLRVMGYIRRFIHNSRSKVSKQTGPLTYEELQTAKTRCIILSQQNAFQPELEALRRNVNIPHDSKIKRESSE